MTVTSRPDRERASDEAAVWLIRLQEEPDEPAVRASFEAWRAAAPLHRVAWADVSETFDLIGQAMPAHEAPEVVAAGRKGPTITRRAFGAAAMVAMTACLAMVFLPRLMLLLDADHATSAGEWREVRLADGSIVDLAPRSAIGVALAPGRRDVRLLEGQAFFRVTPDAARPFQVQAGDVRATVLGTAFDVRLEQEGAVVAVSEGRVRVDYGASKILHGEEWLRVSRARQATAGNAAAGEIGAWRRGQLVTYDRPIAEIVDEMRPWFGGLIVIASDAAARRRVTGVYELRHPVDALQAVARAYDDITVTRVSPWLVIVSGG